MTPIRQPGKAASIVLALALFGGGARADDTTPGEGESGSFRDLEGVVHHPLEIATDLAGNVLIFIMDDCPVANAMQPEIARIVADFNNDFAFYLVHVDPDLPREEAAQHAKDFSIPCAVLHDTNHTLVATTGASIAPEAAVITPDGRIAYLGRINDLYAKLGQRRRAPRTHDLREALSAIRKGTAPPSDRTPAIGCYIADFAPE